MITPFSDPIVQNMLFNKARQVASSNRALHRNINSTVDKANASIAEAQSIIDEQHAEILSLQAQVKELTNIRMAEEQAAVVELAAWRKEHPVSHMHDFVGKFKDGSGIRRNMSIWISAFDAAAKKLGIVNPEIWRIS